MTAITDLSTLAGVDLSDLQTPGMSIEPSDHKDALDVANLDKYSWRQNFFIKLESDTALLIVPIEVELLYFGAFRRGMGSIHGPS